LADTRTRSRFRRTLWTCLAVAVVVLSLTGGLVFWALDPSSLKPRLVEAVQRATGRTLTISGGMSIKLSLVPTVSMEDVALSNPPGFSRPDMVKISRVELGLALLPLLRHEFEVDHITLVRPDTLLEARPADLGTDQPGRPNWVFARGPKTPNSAAAKDVSPAQPSSAPAAPPEGERFAISLKDTSIIDGRFAWIDAKSRRHEVETPRLTLNAPLGEPAQLTGAVTYEGRTIDVTARTVPAGIPGSAWPVSLKLESGGAVVTAEGQIARPLEGRGYTVAIDANVPDPSMLAAFFPRLPLASLKAVTAHAELNDNDGPTPTLTALRVRLGSVHAEKFVHGASLEDVTLTARDTSPIKLAARVTADGNDSGISGSIGDLPWLMKGALGPKEAWGPVAVDLEWNAASARASVKGTIQTPAAFRGVALDVAVDVPDPSLVTNDAPPALKSIAFQTHVTDAPGPVPFQLTSTAGDLTGEFSVSRLPRGSAARISVEGQVWSRLLNLDALRLPPPGTSSPGTSSPGAAPSGGPASAYGNAPAPVPDKSAPLIPDTKLPFELLRAVTGSVKFNFADIRMGGADVRRIDGAVSVKDAQLRLDPFTIAAPDQRLTGLLVADGGKDPPSVHLELDAPGLALRPLLMALGLPGVASGTAEVRADLTGTGDTPRALAASLDGWAGVSVEGGQLDAQMVNSWLGPLQALHIGGGDTTDLRCFALRGDAKSGIVSIKPLALNTAALIVDGNGDIDLGHETLALRLRPRTKIGGTGIALPLRVTGPMRDPSARIDISPGGPGGGVLAGLLLGGKDVMGAAGGGDPCPVALTRARQGPVAPGAGDDLSPPTLGPKP
jgi:AsmA protein